MLLESKEVTDFVRNVRNALAKLPVRNEGGKMKMIAGLLENDFKKIRQKGYGYREIVDFLKQENLTMPAYLVKKMMANRKAEPDNDPAIETDRPADKAPEKKSVKMAAKGAVQAPQADGLVDNLADAGMDMAATKTDNQKGKDPDNQTEDQEGKAPDKQEKNPAIVAGKDVPAVNQENVVPSGKFIVTPDLPDGEL